jgi:hypothetical protein
LDHLEALRGEVPFEAEVGVPYLGEDGWGLDETVAEPQWGVADP